MIKFNDWMVLQGSSEQFQHFLTEVSYKIDDIVAEGHYFYKDKKGQFVRIQKSQIIDLLEMTKIKNIKEGKIK